MRDALESAGATRHHRLRAETLTALVAHLSGPPKAETVRDALEAVQAIDGEPSRTKELGALALPLTCLQLADLFRVWHGTIHRLAARTRRDLLAEIRALGQVIATMGRTEAMAGVARALQDVGRWWP